jgi:hypothetical protein
VTFKYRDLMSSLALAAKQEYEAKPEQGGTLCGSPTCNDRDPGPEEPECPEPTEKRGTICGNPTCQGDSPEHKRHYGARRAAEIPLLQEQLRDTLAQGL